MEPIDFSARTRWLEISKSLKSSQLFCFREGVDRWGVDGFSPAGEQRQVPGPGVRGIPRAGDTLANPMQAISQGTEGAATACHCTIFPDLAKGSLLRLDDGLNRQRVKVSAYLPLKLSLREMLARGVLRPGRERQVTNCMVRGSGAVPSGRMSFVSFPLPGPLGLQEHSSGPLMPRLCSPHMASHYHRRNS